jgi:hypothetical protein
VSRRFDVGDEGVTMMEEAGMVNKDGPSSSLGVFGGGESNQIGFKGVGTADLKIWH